MSQESTSSSASASTISSSIASVSGISKSSTSKHSAGKGIISRSSTSRGGVSRSILNFFKIFALVILSMLLSAAIISFCITFTAKSTVLDSEFIKLELGKNNVYSVVEGIISDMAFKTMELWAQEQGQISESEKEEIATIARTAVQSLGLKYQLEQCVDNGLDYVNGRSQYIDVYVDISNAKSVMRSSLIKSIENKYGKQSPAVAAFSENIDSKLSQVPDKLSVQNQQELSTVRDAFNTARGVAQKIGLIFKLSIFAILIIAVLIFLISWNTVSALRWIGIPMLSAGILLVILSIILPSLIAAAVSGSMAKSPEAGSETAFLTYYDVGLAKEVVVNPGIIITGIISDVFGFLLRIAIAVAVLGLVILIVPFFMQIHKKQINHNKNK